VADRVYVELLGEGVEVRRLVDAEAVGGGTYRLIAPADYDPATEVWQFRPGSVVRCETRLLSDGPTLVAVAKVEEL